MTDLRIDFDALEDVSRVLAEKGEEFQTLLNSIKNSNGQLEDEWYGTDATAYTTAVARQAEVMQKLADAIIEISAFLRRVNETYQAAQEDNTSAINLNN